MIMSLATSCGQFVVDLSQHVVFTLKDDVTSYELGVASCKNRK